MAFRTRRHRFPLKVPLSGSSRRRFQHFVPSWSRGSALIDMEGGSWEVVEGKEERRKRKNLWFNVFLL